MSSSTNAITNELPHREKTLQARLLNPASDGGAKFDNAMLGVTAPLLVPARAIRDNESSTTAVRIRDINSFVLALGATLAIPTVEEETLVIAGAEYGASAVSA
jgi:hypothetical protein